jgi:hypothetical protein
MKRVEAQLFQVPIQERPAISADALKPLPAPIPGPPDGSSQRDSATLVKTAADARWVIFILGHREAASAAERNNLGCAYGRVGEWGTAAATFAAAAKAATAEEKAVIRHNRGIADAAAALDA